MLRLHSRARTLGLALCTAASVISLSAAGVHAQDNNPGSAPQTPH